MSKFRKVINFLLFFCAILCSMLVITVNSENTVPTDGICKHGHSLDVVQEKTYQNGCLVCNLADMIKDLPLGSDIKEENCETVAQQIREIDKIKFDLTDEGYEELLILLDDNYSTDISRYFEAIAALQDLMGNVNLVVTKKFVLEDGAVLDSNDERFKDISISVEVTPMTGFISTSNQMMLLDNTQTFALSYDSSESSLVGTYSLSAYGRYKIREVNTNQPIVINGETYYTKSVSYTYNGNTVMSDDGIEVTTYVGDNTIPIVFANNIIKANVSIEAVDSVTNDVLPGAKLQILGSGSEPVDEWNSTTDAHTVEGLAEGTYTIGVDTPPEGYILPAEDITFKIIGNKNGTISVNIESGSDVAEVVGNTIKVKFEKTKVQIQAVDTNGQALEGAKLQILDSDKNVKKTEWTSVTDAHTVEGLRTGETYTLRISGAPEGYILPADYNFKINDYGKISGFSGTTSEDGIMLVEFEKTKVQIQAVDENGNLLEGAQFKIEGTGESWELNTDAYTVEGLKIGETYTLRVTTPPEGYILPAEDITFKIIGNKNGTISVNIESGSDVAEVVGNTIKVKFEKTKVQIQAVDTNGQALEGAKLQILDSDKNVKKTEWTSVTDAHTVEGLKIGETYTLRVIEAPEGYILPADYNFKINDYGKISGFSGTTSEDGIMLVEFEKTKVQIQAVDENGNLLEGAQFKIEGTGESWELNTDAYTVEGLKIGETYTLRVTTAPDGYIWPVENIIIFRMLDNRNGTISVEIESGSDVAEVVGNTIKVKFEKTQIPVQNNNNSGNKWNIENFESKEINGIKHYFDGGRTYVKIPETPGIVWLKEESDGTSAWYGLDNSSSTFEPNSIFYVEWHSPGSSKYEDLYSQLDKNIKSQIEDDNGWIFQTGVLNQAGDKITEIKNLPVNLYVQIGDDWELKDLKSVYIQSQSDENTAVTYVENLKYPEGTDNFGIMKLKHFSPYFIYDTEDDIITDEDPIDNNTTENTQENIENTDKNNNSNINDSIATGDETTKTIILVSILVIIISGLIIFLSLRRKK